MPCDARQWSDAQLLAASVRDRRAFGVFYRRHVHAVLAYLVSRTRRPDLAADICAEVFAAALEGAHRYDPRRGEAQSWLFSMSSSRLVDAARRGVVEDRARRRLGMPALELDDADLERIEDLLDPQLDAAARLLSELPIEQREAIRARVLDELDYREIAAGLRCSEHVVRKRVSRGLRTLRAQMERQGIA